MTRAIRWLVAFAALSVALAIPATPAAAEPAGAQACADDWIANAGAYDNPDHLNEIDITETNGDVEYLFKGSNGNGRLSPSKYYTVPSGWDILGWDNRTSTPTWRRNSTGTFLIPDQICGGVYWFKGVRNGAAMDRAPMGAAVSAAPAATLACADDAFQNAGGSSDRDPVEVKRETGLTLHAPQGGVWIYHPIISFNVHDGWDGIVWDNLASTPVKRWNSSGWHPMPNATCSKQVWWGKEVRNGSGLDRESRNGSGLDRESR